MSGDVVGIEQHLLYHKALIDDSVDAERIDRYLQILQDERDHERMQDDTDESIRTVFRLVLDEDFDPWAIDLKEFVRTYSKKVKSNKFDIMVAGRLFLMAWKVLRMQSDATKLESDRNSFDDDFDFGFECDPDFFMEEEPSLDAPMIDLVGLYSRSPVRSVTMVELLDAFNEAEEEMRMAEAKEATRLKLKSQIPKFDNKAHKEIDESDVNRVWERIRNIGTGAFALSELYTDDMDNNITVFWSALQLVRNGKLTIWQDELPYGEIMIDMVVDWASAKLEDSEETVKVTETVV